MRTRTDATACAAPAARVHWRAAIVAVALAALLACGGGQRPPETPREPPPSPPPSSGAVWYVSPHGSPGNDGSVDRPLDLATALAAGSPARPGDTIWLRGGVYRGGFASRLHGAPGAPIRVREYPGERAIIDGNHPVAVDQSAALAIFGSNTWFWGFEVTSSDPDRADRREPGGPAGITVLESSNIKLINLRVHDMPGNGLGLWSENVDVEVYGCLVYYNGVNEYDHGMYVQNRTGLKQLVDNVIFRSSGHGVHAFGSSAAFLNDIRLEGNTLFNNGEIVGASDRNILVGGDTRARRPHLAFNATYYPTNGNGANNLGYDAGCVDAVVTDNYFVRGESALQMVNCGAREMARNLLVGNWHPKNLPLLFPDNTYASDLPAGTQVIVRPNRYEPGIALVTVYNRARESRVPIDLSRAGVEPGQRYAIHDVQDPDAGAIGEGVFTGAPVTLPMTGLTTATPVWLDAVRPRHTSPEFAAFLIRSR
jgi:hypothetical protein